MNNNEWMKNPMLNGISQEKLSLLTTILSQSQNKSQNELIPFFLATIQKANSQGISFNDNETDLIINTIKQNMSKEDQDKVDNIRRMSALAINKGKKR